ncbi:hypothetical protein [Pontibacter harenae]|uniref:hypothetical protein n=1 Tax=Pontibacter harenae TaxID=2894083 RepID=UPI001E5B6D61|nr:hypothetical protein [Pontibacter harenae]MCC9167208.1 hypothetical protein [Pontibacter harenae]
MPLNLDLPHKQILLETVQRSSLEQNVSLKKGIWWYFLLLIFEGALRKWLIPELSTPLLVIRDVLAIWLIAKAWQSGMLKLNVYIVIAILIGYVGIITALLFGHGNLMVALFGARIFLLNFPLIFVIGLVFKRGDVVALGKVCLWMAIPMTVLIVLQFYSPQSAWVNRGVGGDLDGAGFSGGAFGYYRPPGTFSFTLGVAQYYSLIACYIFYFWFNPKLINKFVLIGSTAALLVALPFSISRGLVFQVCVSALFTVFGTLMIPKYLSRFIILLIGTSVILLVLSQLSFFQTAADVLLARFDIGNEHEGGLSGTLGDRFLGGMITALENSIEQPFFGVGVGMGTPAGSKILTGTATVFLVSEEEWGRLIGELGPIIGLTAVCLRIALGIKISWLCYRRLIAGDLLPWVLLSFGFILLVQGILWQTTCLGFFTLVGGLMFASLLQKPKVST